MKNEKKTLFSARLTLLERAIAKGRYVCLSLCPSVCYTREPRYVVYVRLSKYIAHHMRERRLILCLLTANFILLSLEGHLEECVKEMYPLSKEFDE